MSTQRAALPADGFVRQSDLIGEQPISHEEAEVNRLSGKHRPRRPRQGATGIVPFSATTLWRKVKRGEFPAPLKLSAGITAWRVQDVRAWMDAQGAQS